MLQSQKNSKGEIHMKAYGSNQKVYDAIYANFPNKAQADSVILAFEQAISYTEISVQKAILEQIDIIVLKVTVEIKKEFATKADLDNVRLILEKQIADVKSELKQEIADVKSELKQEIAEFKIETEQRFSNVDKQIAELHKDNAIIHEKLINLDKKIDSNLKWIGLMVTGAAVFVSVLANLSNIISLFK